MLTSPEDSTGTHPVALATSPRQEPPEYGNVIPQPEQEIVCALLMLIFLRAGRLFLPDL